MTNRYDMHCHLFTDHMSGMASVAASLAGDLPDFTSMLARIDSSTKRSGAATQRKCTASHEVTRGSFLHESV